LALLKSIYFSVHAPVKLLQTNIIFFTYLQLVFNILDSEV